MLKQINLQTKNNQCHHSENIIFSAKSDLILKQNIFQDIGPFYFAKIDYTDFTYPTVSGRFLLESDHQAIWRGIKLVYLSADIICSERRIVSRELRSMETVTFEEQIMSKEKYPSIFPSLMVASGFIILQLFFAARVVLKIEDYHSGIPQF